MQQEGGKITKINWENFNCAILLIWTDYVSILNPIPPSQICNYLSTTYWNSFRSVFFLINSWCHSAYKKLQARLEDVVVTDKFSKQLQRERPGCSKVKEPSSTLSSCRNAGYKWINCYQPQRICIIISRSFPKYKMV
jgi:hypothetical protein